ncbi:hypothetical protein SBRCBS47491_000964 [Sporothrix bragantina]|uniref:Uncharacterized protein n=1 Tax=Sporothrix bragantina TaxID=671064 RepID=A0ABP0AUN1_9PEZI
MAAFLGCPQTPSPPTSTPVRSDARDQDFSKPAAMAIDDVTDDLADQLASLNFFAKPAKSTRIVDKEGQCYMAFTQARPRSLAPLVSLAKPVNSLSLALAAMPLSGPKSTTKATKDESLTSPFLRIGKMRDRA